MHEEIIKRIWTPVREECVNKIVYYSKSSGKIEDDFKKEIFLSCYYQVMSSRWRWFSFLLMVVIALLLWR